MSILNHVVSTKEKILILFAIIAINISIFLKNRYSEFWYYIYFSIYIMHKINDFFSKINNSLKYILIIIIRRIQISLYIELINISILLLTMKWSRIFLTPFYITTNWNREGRAEDAFKVLYFSFLIYPHFFIFWKNGKKL